MDIRNFNILTWLRYLRDNYQHQIDEDKLILKLANGNISFSKKLGLISFKNNYAVITDTHKLIDIEGENTYETVYEFIEKYDIETFIRLVLKRYNLQ